MAAIIIASSRRGCASRPREVWADVILAVNSATLYATDHRVVLAWQGPCEPPELLDNPRLELFRQPASCRSYGEAYAWAVSRTDENELILMNDDAVLTPSTVPLLLEDVELIRRQHPDLRIGMLACRSNFVGGAQNVRASNDSKLRPNCNRFESEERILAAARVSPIVAWIPREALEAIGGFPPINWFSDDLMCHDLLQRGYTHFISRAYAHHIGQRSTTQDGVTEADLQRTGLEWVRRHRPDFWTALQQQPPPQ